MRSAKEIFRVATGTTSATLGTWKIVPSRQLQPEDGMWTQLMAGFEGGSTDTTVQFVMETGVDGTNWLPIGTIGLTASTKSVNGQGGSAQLAEYLRIRVVVAGTAPSARTGAGLLLASFPFELVAVA